MNGQPDNIYDDMEKSVDAIIEKVGKDIVFAMPLALGKPARFVNALYQRVKSNPDMSLKIVTALALEKPTASSDLERRMLEPLVDRIFGGTPDFDYMLDFRSGKLPSNIEIFEFFNKAGGYMGNPVAQQNHLNSNYTHVVRDGINFGTNVFGQMLAVKEINGEKTYSMGCNTDIDIEAIDILRKKAAAGERVAVVAEVNPNLPYMYGDALVDIDRYDVIVDTPECNYPLFGPPKDSCCSKRPYDRT